MNTANTESNPEAAVRALFGDFQSDPKLPYNDTIQKSLLVAQVLQRRATELQTPAEKKQQMELDRMIQNPGDKVTLTALTDQAFRSEESARAADQLTHILDVQGVPRFFSPFERTLLRGFQSFGSYLPGVAVPLVKEQMRRETANVILPAEKEHLKQHLNARRDEGVRMNVNYLGEAILGEEEAHRRLTEYLLALQYPEIEVMSVKISTIYSQISPIARKNSIRTMCDRMELLYRAAAKSTFTRADGTEVPKFVYLDMEEYRDLSLTAEVFMQTLDRPGLEHMTAGIVFQAYIPDSFLWQQEVTEWAKQRVANGGAPITVRIVKGANMEMERVEASHHGWPQTPFKTKVETDANYKQMVQYALQSENLKAVCPGVASHNLFDISYALVLAFEYEALGDIQFEMLEGMANHQRRALHELTRSLLLYAPACPQENFIHAIGYLVRRLDENTGEENFLRHAFNITVGSEAWMKLEAGFLKAFEKIETLDNQPRRKQNRLTEHASNFDSRVAGVGPKGNPGSDSPSPADNADPRETGASLAKSAQSSPGHPVVNSDATEVTGDPHEIQFTNEPDTDFSLPQNSEWAHQIVKDWIDRCGDHATKIPLYIAGELVTEKRPERKCFDPSRDSVVVATYHQANEDDANRAVDCAKSDPDGWRSMPSADRFAILKSVAEEIRKARADLMGAALADGGKTLAESDPEVSEAVDFLEFYVDTARYFEQLEGIEAKPRGVIVVVSPWNFPVAIPCGGIAAALATGNTVILKPASNTVLIAHQLCECFYRAGVPRTALQLLPCSGGTVGQQLVSHADVDTVILTGGTDTAISMLENKPELRLLAETGGKNATIVTALSDRDQAIKHITQSAFGHCGQKCSATSLLLLEDEVFDDESFRDALVDAVDSLKVGSAWDLWNKLGPMISPPSGDLERGLKELEPGESWALMPKRSAISSCIYSPGIKWNVKPGTYTHETEFFGPVLAVMKFRKLREAIEIVNQTGFGLTSGLESLDSREQLEWKNAIRAGNLYINRSTTGAIVLRQPFGGMGKSAFGPGIKAGGPNYVTQLMHFTATGEESRPDQADRHRSGNSAPPNPNTPALQHLASQLPDTDTELKSAIDSYDEWAATEFIREHDHFNLVGQDNIRRYLPIDALCIRIAETDTWFDIVARTAAARSVGCRVIISSPPNTKTDELTKLDQMTEDWAAAIEFVEQTDADLLTSIKYKEIHRLRYASPDAVPDSIRRGVIGHYIHIADTPVLAHGRLELMNYVEEQSVCIDYHRYGNLGARANEERQPVL